MNIPDIGKELNDIKTFAGRKALCKQKLVLLGSGTGRAVFDLGDNKTVLKLALNKRGQAQNNTESDFGIRQAYGDCVAQCLYSHGDDWYIVCEKADNARTSDFLRVFGVSMDTIFSYFDMQLDLKKQYYHTPLAKVYDLDKNDLVQEFLNLLIDYELCSGDIGRKGSWGMVGQKLCLRDYGLTLSVFREFYIRR